MVAILAESGERRAEKQVRSASTATSGNRPGDAPGHPCLALAGLLAVATETHPLERLPPPTRAAILMTLLGILLVVGLLLVVIILLGGNWVRKLGTHHRRPSVPPDVEPLRPRPGRDIPPSTTNHLPFQQPSQENPNNHETQVSDETKEQ